MAPRDFAVVTLAALWHDIGKLAQNQELSWLQSHYGLQGRSRNHPTTG